MGKVSTPFVLGAGCSSSRSCDCVRSVRRRAGLCLLGRERADAALRELGKHCGSACFQDGLGRHLRTHVGKTTIGFLLPLVAVGRSPKLMAEYGNQINAMFVSVNQIIKKERLLLEAAIELQNFGANTDADAKQVLSEDVLHRRVQLSRAREILLHSTVRAAACNLLVEHCERDMRCSLREAACYVTHTHL